MVEIQCVAMDDWTQDLVLTVLIGMRILRCGLHVLFCLIYVVMECFTRSFAWRHSKLPHRFPIPYG